MENDNNFKATLRFYGISKRELGSTLGLSQPTIKSYCDNPTKFRLEHLKTICKLTNKELSEIENIVNGTQKGNK